MRIAVVGSRSAQPSEITEILSWLPAGTSEIVSGGATGIDRMAEEVAHELQIPTRIFLPDYEKYHKNAPLMRNQEIVRYADEVLAFWDGSSHGTRQTILECLRQGKPVHIIPLSPISKQK